MKVSSSSDGTSSLNDFSLIGSVRSLVTQWYSIAIPVSCVLLLVGCAGIGGMAGDRADASNQVKLNGTTGVKRFTRGNKSPYEVLGKTYEVLPTSLGYREIGIASWYGKKFHGRLTSNGEVYDMYQLSAAHKALPLPTTVKVTNLDNGKSVILRVNDRGPFHEDRVIDLSYETALQLGFANKGTAPVVVEALTAVNHPEVSVAPSETSFYLQVGAFSKIGGAEKLKDKITRLIVEHAINSIEVRILKSELETTSLHKVWLGPMSDAAQREVIALWVEEAELGSPIRVQVE